MLWQLVLKSCNVLALKVLATLWFSIHVRGVLALTADRLNLSRLTVAFDHSCDIIAYAARTRKNHFPQNVRQDDKAILDFTQLSIIPPTSKVGEGGGVCSRLTTTLI